MAVTWTKVVMEINDAMALGMKAERVGMIVDGIWRMREKKVSGVTLV